MNQYRHLTKGELIREGDEVNACRNGYRDDLVWIKVKHRIGDPAPDPDFIGHSQFRRKISE